MTRGLLFGVNCGWDKGLRNAANEVTRTSRNLVDGVSNGAAPASGVARVNGSGWALCSSNDSWYEYAPTSLSAISTPAGLTVAALVEPLVLPGVSTFNRRVVQKRLSGAPTDPGFDLFLDSFVSLSWSFEWSDGVAEQTLRAGIPVLNEQTLLVATLDTQANMATLSINASGSNSTALTIVPVNPAALPVAICGGIGPVNDRGGDNCVSMAAVWNRPISPREITQLWADPFTMWRR